MDADVDNDTLLAFQSLFDTSEHANQTIDLARLRALCSAGIPDHPPHLRTLAYSLMLGVLPLDKQDWKHTAKTQRGLYYGLVRQHMETTEDLPPPPNRAPVDKLLLQICRDVGSAQARFRLLAHRLPTSASAPLAPVKKADRDNVEDVDDAFSSGSDDEAHLRPQQLVCRRAMFDRVSQLVQAEVPGQAVATVHSSSSPPKMTTPQLSLSLPDEAHKPKTILESKSIASQAFGIGIDTHAEVIARLLFVFSQANPRWVYHQGLVDVLSMLYTAFAQVQWVTRRQRRMPVIGGKWAEERTYWAFCALVRELEAVLMGSDINQALDCFQRRSRWLDAPLCDMLEESGLFPPVFASRWIGLLLVQDIPRPFATPVWDYMLASDEPVDTLIDLCASVLVVGRPVLLGSNAKRPQARGLFTDSQAPDVPDPEQMLRFLHAMPLEACGDRAAVPRVAAKLRQARTEEGVQGLKFKDEAGVEPGMFNQERLANLTKASASWTSAAITSVSSSLSTSSLWSSLRSWSKPDIATEPPVTTAFEETSSLSQEHVTRPVRSDPRGIIANPLTSPETPPSKRSSLQGPRPLILSSSAKRIVSSSASDRRRDSTSSSHSGYRTPPAGTLSPPAPIHEGGTTPLYRIGSKQGAPVSRKRLSEISLQGASQSNLGSSCEAIQR